MDELEKEVIRLRIQIKHNLKRLIENTKWNRTFECLVVSHGIFDVQSLEALTKFSTPAEHFYEEIIKILKRLWIKAKKLHVLSVTKFSFMWAMKKI